MSPFSIGEGKDVISGGESCPNIARGFTSRGAVKTAIGRGRGAEDASESSESLELSMATASRERGLSCVLVFPILRLFTVRSVKGI